MIVKTEDNDFNRDDSNLALINSNVEAYRMYRRQRAQQTEHANLQRQIDTLKSDMDDIKGMLKVLIQRENNVTNNG
jgi:septal ring factor EnvC (AmiA/AmiB activator)